MEPLVKEEAAEKSDCNLDLKVELNIRSERGLSTGGCSRLRTTVSVTPPQTQSIRPFMSLWDSKYYIYLVKKAAISQTRAQN